MTGYNKVWQSGSCDITSAEVEFEMKAALESAKDNPNFKAMFGDSMPSVEEFIETIVDMLLIL